MGKWSETADCVAAVNHDSVSRRLLLLLCVNLDPDSGICYSPPKTQDLLITWMISSVFVSWTSYYFKFTFSLKIANDL